MTKKILLTSFDVWKQHHSSNSSDDLLHELIQHDRLPQNTYLLRKLPVDFQLAPEAVISKIEEWEPDAVVCCGMAERRSLLSIESNGKHEEEVVQTTVDVDRLVAHLETTRISHNAGKFVCNHLYYSVLKHLNTRRRNVQCIFVHVPVLDGTNRAAIVADFSSILHSLQIA